MSDEKISYEGIDEAVLLHGLYHGTRPLGMGFLHNMPGYTVEDARAEINWRKERAVQYGGGNRLSFDYVAGRPIKVTLDTEKKTIDSPYLYDRDAGEGACQSVVDRLRRKVA